MMRMMNTVDYLNKLGPLMRVWIIESSDNQSRKILLIKFFLHLIINNSCNHSNSYVNKKY